MRQSQLSAWNKPDSKERLDFLASTVRCYGLTGLLELRSMMQTYNTYIPGPYENFAEQATEDTRKGTEELRSLR